jgi:hypothetical protein
VGQLLGVFFFFQIQIEVNLLSTQSCSSTLHVMILQTVKHEGLRIGGNIETQGMYKIPQLECCNLCQCHLLRPLFSST